MLWFMGLIASFRPHPGGVTRSWTVKNFGMLAPPLLIIVVLNIGCRTQRLAEQPDLTLNEIVAALAKRRIMCSRTAVWRFFDRRDITYKKNSVRGRAEACGSGPRASALDARARHV